MEAFVVCFVFLAGIGIGYLVSWDRSQIQRRKDNLEPWWKGEDKWDNEASRLALKQYQYDAAQIGKAWNEKRTEDLVAFVQSREDRKG
jgi:hypothetical protein